MEIDTVKVDVLIIGAGPCGLACAVEAEKKNLSHLVLDKGSLTDSIRRYPNRMHFFSTPESMEIGEIPFPTSGAKASRVEALEYYRKVTTFYNLNFRLFKEVSQIDKGDDYFKVITKEGEIFYARNVIVAVGFFDFPRRLNIPGEDLPHVSHYYEEPFKYSFTKVAIVGGGNSAIEAALELNRHDADVTIVHRSEELSSTAKPWLVPTIHDRISEGKVKVMFQSEAASIEDGIIRIHNNKTGERHELPVDFVFLMVGFLPNKELLQRFGVRLQEDKLKPIYNPETFKTNVEGLYLAGTVVAGSDTDEVMIKIGRDHSKAIIKDILSKQKKSASKKKIVKWHIKENKK
jgi:thioredoxin reductase (NADPH)